MTQDIFAILEQISPGFDREAFQRLAGGRQWYVPSLRVEDQRAVREAIRRDPCRDYKVVSRRYRVSPTTVYDVWNERKAG